MGPEHHQQLLRVIPVTSLTTVLITRPTTSFFLSFALSSPNVPSVQQHPSFFPLLLFLSVHYPQPTNTAHVFFFSNPQTSCIMHRIPACALHVVHQTSSLMESVPGSSGCSGCSRGVSPLRLRLAVYYFCPPPPSAT